MTTVSDKCREDIRRLFEDDMTAEELIAAWRWLDDSNKRNIPHWSDTDEKE